MNHNDIPKAITAEDLIRRYNLEKLKVDRNTIKVLQEDLVNTNKLIDNFADAVTKDLENLQDQVDGNITTWFFNGVPTLETEPAINWINETDKINHLGDLYYDQDTGYAYRFSKEEEEYKWVEIKDTDVVKALALANSAQDTADRKRTTFVETPSPPYEVGDLWVKEDKDLYRCRATRTEGEFHDVDWVLATDYSNDDYAKEVAAGLNKFKETVESDYVSNSIFETTVDSINSTVAATTTEVRTLESGQSTLSQTVTEQFKSVEEKIEANTFEINASQKEYRDGFQTTDQKLAQLLLDINNLLIGFQNSGGNNLLKNSVMFARNADDVPDNWNVDGTGTMQIQTDSESLNQGAISGHSFTLLNKKVSQKIGVKVDNASIPEEEKTYYTFSTKIKKLSSGTCYVKIYNSQESYEIKLENGEESNYKEYKLEALLPKENYYTVEFYGTEDSGATFTDNMFALGSFKTQWTQASGEMMNTQVNINMGGITVKSAVYEGSYTNISPLEFAGYAMKNGVITRVFSLNGDTTVVDKLQASEEISMPPLKIVPVFNDPLKGDHWAFVPVKAVK